MLPLLIRHLAKLDFEWVAFWGENYHFDKNFRSKKDVALIFNNLLRRQIGTRSPTVEYLCARPEILMILVRGYEVPEIALTCGTWKILSFWFEFLIFSGTMLRECVRHEHLAKIILHSEQFYDFFRYVEVWDDFKIILFIFSQQPLTLPPMPLPHLRFSNFY